MENDRQETIATLKKERERTKKLRLKIDNHCMAKMRDMPLAVQQGKTSYIVHTFASYDT
jgi:hypothetical protein